MTLRLITLLLAACAVGASAQSGLLERRFVRLELPEFGCSIFDFRLQLLMRVAFHMATGAHLEGHPRKYCEGLNNLVLYAEIRDLTPSEAAELDNDAAGMIRRNLEKHTGLSFPKEHIKVTVRREGNCEARHVVVGWMEDLTNTCVAVKCQEGYALEADANLCQLDTSTLPGNGAGRTVRPVGEDDDEEGGPGKAMVALFVVLVIALIIASSVATYFCCCRKTVPMADESKVHPGEPVRTDSFVVVDVNGKKTPAPVGKEMSTTEDSELA